MVRKKNVLATLMQSFAITCVITILVWADWIFVALHRVAGLPRGAQTRALFKWHDDDERSNKLTVSHLRLTIPGKTVYAMFQLDICDHYSCIDCRCVCLIA